MITILISQVIMMFLLTSVGFLLFKTGKISQEGSKSIGNILIFVSLPMVIVNGFMVERTPERLTGLLISALVAVLIVSACPVGSNVAVYAQLHDCDYGYAVETVVISTLFALATMPALVWLSGIIW